MKELNNWFLSLLTVSLVSGCVSGYDSSIDSNENGYRRVGHVVWDKEDAMKAQVLVDNEIPANSAGVFFLRPQDDDGLQTSANVAINDRFQVSLQPGRYSHVYSCAGINDLSVDITGNKHNDLKRGLDSFPLESGKNYFFGVDVSDTGAARIEKVPANVATEAMKDMLRQTHQISRVVPNCAPAPSRIELKVLFDTDKHFVKRRYYYEIERVAKYMKAHPKTKASLEGHTDSRASDQYNINLSQRRVNAVMRILVEKYAIPQSRLKAVGFGERRPIAPNNSAVNMQKNRRVIAVFSYK